MGGSPKDFDLSKEQIGELVSRLQPIADRAKKHGLTISAVGRTGVGKSSTINALVGKNVAPVGHFARTTATVERYDVVLNEIPCTFVDTPGLCDEAPELANSSKYFNMLHNKVPIFDCLLFITQLNFARVDGCEKSAIKDITTAFGDDVWEHAVVVFTHATDKLPRPYAETLEVRTRLLREEIRSSAGEKGAPIPAVAVDHESSTTPDGREWLGELYMAILRRIRPEGVFSYLIATSVEQRGLGKEDLIEAATYVEKEEGIGGAGGVLALLYLGVGPGAAVGGMIGGPVGAAVGAIAGPLVLLLLGRERG